MDREQITRVRRFNRTVTQRVGALHDAYLTRDRPLGQARLLWEIGPRGADVRALRSRLELDSGYLSRLLRTLQADGLIDVVASEADGRVRTARLTGAGLAEWSVLDQRSDELAGSILTPLAEHQRDRLITAMAEVERLLAASEVVIEECDPSDPQAQYCLLSYAEELDARFPGGFDPGQSLPVADAEVTPPAGLLLVAMSHTEPVGCVALKRHDDAPFEIKRLWVAPSARGLGLARRLLTEVEDRARRAGATAVRLDTNAALTEAIALYRSSGYREVPAYNDEPYAHHWFEKHLEGRPWTT
ncbi:MAG: GNAT family N-acetyltransferase [Streptosporangiales bacterium]|nr:GNAT family N-acetyltransferase [Streptosporangiales bacterium]